MKAGIKLLKKKFKLIIVTNQPDVARKIITKKRPMTYTGHGTCRYVTLFAVAPAIIVLADIAHLDLIAGRIAGRIGQNPALKRLYQ